MANKVGQGILHDVPLCDVILAKTDIFLRRFLMGFGFDSGTWLRMAPRVTGM